MNKILGHAKFVGQYTGCFLRRRISRNKAGVENVYHASVQKTGSQWIKTVFNDEDIRKKTMLATYPQHRYEWDEFKKRFPRYSFVPGLYVSYQLYEEILKPDNDNYITIYVKRDPRDLIISWYYSMKYSHTLMGKVGKHRKVLQEMNRDNGITYAIKNFNLKLSFMRDWQLNCDDPNVICLKFEDLVKEPLTHFKNFFDACNIEISDDLLTRVLNRYTKEKMRKKDNNKEMSHYRKDPKSWEELFKDQHIELFDKINGNLVEILGYNK